ncbi:MAG: hypothetical protein JSU96_11765 [Acidobacteriota bacterium]|nr:MAG: hypothetical protein JSU96_11765 [Acidobacteriota bacterium]
MKRFVIASLVLAVFLTPTVSGAKDKSETEFAVFGEAPDGTADLSSSNPVVVGTNVWTYSPEFIELFLSDHVVDGTGISSGSHWGRARCLKKNGPEGGRLDFYFDCTGELLETCSYRLIVRFGIYDKKNDIVVFDPGSLLLYLTQPEYQLLRDTGASFSIAFQEAE